MDHLLCSGIMSVFAVVAIGIGALAAIVAAEAYRERHERGAQASMVWCAIMSAGSVTMFICAAYCFVVITTC